MTVIPPGFGLCAINFSLVDDPEPMVMTIGVDLGVSDFQGQAETLFDHLGDAGCPQDQINTMTSITAVQLYVGQDGGPPLVFEALGLHLGTRLGDALPQNCAYLIRKTTAGAGRRNRGRFYMPGLVEGDVNHAGRLAAGRQAAIDGCWGEWSGAVQGDASNPIDGFVILHSEGVSATPAPTPITGFSTAPVIATQRRRLRP